MKKIAVPLLVALSVVVFLFLWALLEKGRKINALKNQTQIVSNAVNSEKTDDTTKEANCADGIVFETIIKFKDAEVLRIEQENQKEREAHRRKLLDKNFWTGSDAVSIAYEIETYVLPNLQPATIDDYKKWMCGYIKKHPGDIRNFKSYAFFVVGEKPFKQIRKGYGFFEEDETDFDFSGWFVAKNDFIMPPSVSISNYNYNTKSFLHVIVPKGIKIEHTKDLGTNQLYFMDNYRIEGGNKIEIPIF